MHGEWLSLTDLGRFVEMIYRTDGQIECDHGVAELPIVQVNGVRAGGVVAVSVKVNMLALTDVGVDDGLLHSVVINR